MSGSGDNWRTRTCWDLDREDLWSHVLESGWKKSLPQLALPEDEEEISEFEDWIRSLARAVRASARHGRKRELHSMFWWMFGARDGSGFEETVGFDHDDKIEISAKVTALREEEAGIPLHDRQLHSWLNVTTAVTLYESTIRDGVLFLNSVLKTIAREPYEAEHQGIWNTVFDSEEGEKKAADGNPRSGLHVPYFDETVKKAHKSLGHAPTKDPLTESDEKAIREFLKTLSAKGDFPNGSNVKGVRDRIAHGKFFVRDTGRMDFDHQAHNLVNVASGTPGRNEPHPYAFRGLDYESTDGMLRTANAFVVVLYAMYEEFRQIGAFCPAQQKCSIHPDLVREAKRELERVSPAEKRQAKEQARKERAEVLSKIEVTPADGEELEEESL